MARQRQCPPDSWRAGLERALEAHSRVPKRRKVWLGLQATAIQVTSKASRRGPIPAPGCPTAFFWHNFHMPPAPTHLILLQALPFLIGEVAAGDRGGNQCQPALEHLRQQSACPDSNAQAKPRTDVRDALPLVDVWATGKQPQGRLLRHARPEQLEGSESC